MNVKSNIKKLSEFFITRKSWCLAFIAVMLIHTVVIATMITNKKEHVEISAAPASAVIMVYAQASTPAKKTIKKTEMAPVAPTPATKPEIIIKTQTNNGKHQAVEKSPLLEVTDIKKEAVKKEIKEEVTEEPTKPIKKTKPVEPVENNKEETPDDVAVTEVAEVIEEENNTDSQQALNQQVSLHAEHQIDKGAVAKNQNELAMVQWQHKVQAHLEGLKRYPPLALKQKRQGTVTVHFDINKEGEIISSSLSKTSGVRMLDNATEQLISRANPLPKPPAHILSQRLSIEVPVRYFIL